MEWNGMEEELIYIYMCVFLLTRHRLMGYGSDPVGSASPSSHALRSAGLGVSACKGVVIGWHCYEQVSAMRFFFTWHENRWSGVQWVQGSRHRVAPFLKPVNAINSSSLHVLVWVEPGQGACDHVATFLESESMLYVLLLLLRILAQHACKEVVIVWHLFSSESML